ncbi:hypothetical protein EV360DRAFT_69580 [Lentinula raphanica]|nr:hypothetical protein EV360DRAFT_69580 [Lentinula raphanica]
MDTQHSNCYPPVQDDDITPFQKHRYRPLTTWIGCGKYDNEEIKLLFLSTLIGFALFSVCGLVVFLHVPECIPTAPGEYFYSPAQDQVRYEERQFDLARMPDAPTPFQATPSEELDELWKDLFRYSVNQIPKSQARFLQPKTVPIPGDTSNYIVGLDMFHQIHCLYSIHKVLNPDYYPKIWEDHSSHCIELLREAIMCSGSITPLVWQWNDTLGEAEMRWDVVHTCRSFDLVHKWAKDNQLRRLFLTDVHVEDDL